MTDEMRVNMESYVDSPEHHIVLGMLQCRNRTDDALEKAFEKTIAERIDALWKMGHYGCFEEASCTLMAYGVTRSLLAQLTRHRLFTFKVIRMRAVPYVTEDAPIAKYLENVGGLDVIVPPSIQEENSGLASSLYHDGITFSRTIYQELLRLGIPEEDARMIAPIGTETQIRVTGNLRVWLHFLNMRTPKSRDRNEEYVAGKGPQWEIRNLAWMCYDLLKEYSPNVFAERHMDKWVYV